jgi:hypothetical protein
VYISSHRGKQAGQSAAYLNHMQFKIKTEKGYVQTAHQGSITYTPDASKAQLFTADRTELDVNLVVWQLREHNVACYKIAVPAKV